MISARRIWAATKQQMLIEENAVWLKHRLTTVTSSSSTQLASDLLYRMINDIDVILAKSNQTDQTSTVESNSAYENEKTTTSKKMISFNKRSVQVQE